jgi:hypothetical protein
MGVTISPGDTALTMMRYAASSIAAVRVTWRARPWPRGRVRRRPGGVFVHASDVDDPSAVTGGDHSPGGALQAEKGAVEIDGQHLRPGGEVEVQQRGGGVGPGAVDEHVEAAEGVGQVVDDGAGVG